MQTKTALETIIRMAEAGEFGIADVAKRALAELVSAEKHAAFGLTRNPAAADWAAIDCAGVDMMPLEGDVS